MPVIDPTTRSSGEDAADAAAGNQTHVIYFVPRDGRDDDLDTNGTLGRAVDGIRDWFSRQMRKQPRMDRIAGGSAYDITFVRGTDNTAAYSSLSVVVTDLRKQGFSAAEKRYLIFAALDHGTTCGEGESPSLTGELGRYAAVYLDSAASCGAREFGTGTAAGSGRAETIAAHEWLHNEGVVPLGAPHQCLPPDAHVCTGPLWVMGDLDPESTDVMFPIIVRKLGQTVLDRNRDDYLDHPFPYRNLRESPWLE